VSEWTSVNYDHWQETDRLPVPGGWLYRTTRYGRPPRDEEEGAVEGMAIAFVPDPDAPHLNGGAQ
jgi:hypothetical protein